VFGAAWHPVGISAADLARQAVVVREAAAQAGRPVPELAPRLPVQFGAGGEALAVGRMTTIHGTPDEVTAKLREYGDAGASEIVCLFNSPRGDIVVEQMELFAKHVMPVLAPGIGF
jgi:alkanesulfonate monooxygenase SsuD/methylene tetrahydromethanopterin reductase-like flavin-dependent oxidoreductase (luciferase family)